MFGKLFRPSGFQRMLEHESENFRELSLYFISTQQWFEACELHQQSYGSSPADAQNAIQELAARYGYTQQRKTSSLAILATCSLMTAAVTTFLVRFVG